MSRFGNPVFIINSTTRFTIACTNHTVANHSMTKHKMTQKYVKPSYKSHSFEPKQQANLMSGYPMGASVNF